MQTFFLAISCTHSMSRLPQHWPALLLGIVKMPSNIIRLQFLLFLGHVYSQYVVVKWSHQDDLDIKGLPPVHQVIATMKRITVRQKVNNYQPCHLAVTSFLFCMKLEDSIFRPTRSASSF